MSTSVLVRAFISDDGFPLAGVAVRLESMVVTLPTLLGTATTDNSGVARFAISTSSTPLTLLTPRISIRASIIDQSNMVVRAVTRTVRLGASNRIAIGLKAAAYLNSGLAPVIPDNRPARLAKICRELTNEARTPLGREQLCLLHAILGTMTRLDAPKNDIEKQAAALVTKQFGATAAKQAGRAAEDMLKTIKTCKLPPEVDCTDKLDIDGMAQRFFGGSMPIYKGLQELARRQEADPSTTLGPQGRGWPFTTPFKPSKNCASQYQVDYPNGSTILNPATVNLIEAWDPGLQSVVREGHVGQRRLVARALDMVHGWNVKTTDMNVPVTSNTALLMVTDDHAASLVVPVVAHPVTGNQVLAVDVRPGLKIRLSGANFIDDTCTMTAEFRAWDAPNDRKLVPRATTQPAAGLDGLQLTVHGDNTQPANTADVTNSSRDVIVFEWPATLTTPGLYSLHLSFANNTGIPTTMIHGPNCDTTPDFGVVRSQVLHFVILPGLIATAATVRLTEARCTEKNSLYDNVFTSFNGFTLRYAIDPSTGGFDGTSVEETSGNFSQLVFMLPGNWDPALLAYPGNPPRVLRFDEITTALLVAMDNPHALDKIFLSIAIFALFVIGLLIIIALIAAAIFVIFLSAGALAPVIIGALITGTFTIGGALVGFLVAALGNAYNILVASINAEPIGTVILSFGGAELAHLTSDFRFHQAIWTVPRSTHYEAAGGMDHESGSINTTRIRERWESQAGGGDYRFTTEARPS